MRVGFIGLGTMGASFASNLQKTGFDLVVHDIDREAARAHLEAGARWADTPRELGESVDVVLTSLPGPVEVEAVALGEPDGLVAGMRPRSVYFDLSTVSPRCIRRVHDVLAGKDIRVLDAPVSGGPKGAMSGKLAIWVGGDRAVFDEYRAPLDALGDRVRHVGPIGAGCIAKLVHNGAGYAIQCAVAEIFIAGVKAGLEPLALWEAIRQGARGRQRTFDSLADQFLVNRYEPAAFALRLAHKDVALANEMGRDAGVPMRLLSLTQAEMSEALNRGWGELDSRSFLRLQQERAGLEIAVAEELVRAALEADGSGD